MILDMLSLFTGGLERTAVMLTEMGDGLEEHGV